MQVHVWFLKNGSYLLSLWLWLALTDWTCGLWLALPPGEKLTSAAGDQGWWMRCCSDHLIKKNTKKCLHMMKRNAITSYKKYPPHVLNETSQSYFNHFQRNCRIKAYCCTIYLTWTRVSFRNCWLYCNILCLSNLDREHYLGLGAAGYFSDGWGQASGWRSWGPEGLVKKQKKQNSAPCCLISKYSSII